MNRKTVERGVGGWDWGLGIGKAGRGVDGRVGSVLVVLNIGMLGLGWRMGCQDRTRWFCNVGGEKGLTMAKQIRSCCVRVGEDWIQEIVLMFEPYGVDQLVKLTKSRHLPLHDRCASLCSL